MERGKKEKFALLSLSPHPGHWLSGRDKRVVRIDGTQRARLNVCACPSFSGFLLLFFCWSVLQYAHCIWFFLIHICAVTFGCHGRWLLPLLLLHILTAEVVSGKPNRCDYEQLSPDEDNNNRADSKKSGKNKSERHRRFGSIDDDNGNSSQEEEDEDSGNQKRIRPPHPTPPFLISCSPRFFISWCNHKRRRGRPS